MTEIADDRSWWADVDHLRPGADGPSAPLHGVPSAVADHTRDRPDPVDEAPARHGRITGRPLPADDRARTDRDRAARDPRDEPARSGRDREEQARADRARARDERLAVLRRADAADFAAAMDLDGAFGAPAARAESREIVLSGRRRADSAPTARRLGDEGGPRHAAPRRGSRPASADAERPTVRISGHGGPQAEVAERRALREIEIRRPRSVSEPAEHRPDRVAMYAVLLGVFLVLVAALSSGGVS
ncbi:hypothetical protein NBH00_12100 [Paraconexibacter antarcticus]|uniref:Uncharacterized protein n=1 Tax=Paraconexibacter antarcticus TaxID=2949664 RepID=A0ABY5DY12_9ACTN|nr:hypothetical protein [Paraconexibacter antarcticus]UTI66921.1 hypothetical protein NBH00_12100 [Paraconexibacter antarcticus]